VPKLIVEQEELGIHLSIKTDMPDEKSRAVVELPAVRTPRSCPNTMHIFPDLIASPYNVFAAGQL